MFSHFTTLCMKGLMWLKLHETVDLVKKKQNKSVVMKNFILCAAIIMLLFINVTSHKLKTQSPFWIGLSLVVLFFKEVLTTKQHKPSLNCFIYFIISFKYTLSGLKQFLATESTLKMMIYDITDWFKNNCNTHIGQYLKN